MYAWLAGLLLLNLALADADVPRWTCGPSHEDPSLIVCDNGKVYAAIESKVRVLESHEGHKTVEKLTNGTDETPGAEPLEPTYPYPVECERTGIHEVDCAGVEYDSSEMVPVGSGEFYMYLFSSLGLICTAGMMSGLQLGILSLEPNNLKILINVGEGADAENAKKILKLVSNRHLLLVTLLIGNACCLEALPLFLDKLLSPMANIMVSVTAVLFFGEIIPQAVCVRFGLAIGAVLSPMVWCLIFITFPLSWPIAKLLDGILGHGNAGFFRRTELAELVAMQQSEAVGDQKLSEDEAKVLRGALMLSQKTVKDCLTPREQVHMVDIDDMMTFELMEEIKNRGHSRIPVYREHKDCIIGMLLSRDLILLDPNESRPVNKLPVRKIPTVSEQQPLYDMINVFQMTKIHIASVISTTDRMTLLGVVTLEDVIEEILQEEIEDEFDSPAGPGGHTAQSSNSFGLSSSIKPPLDRPAPNHRGLGALGLATTSRAKADLSDHETRDTRGLLDSEI